MISSDHLRTLAYREKMAAFAPGIPERKTDPIPNKDGVFDLVIQEHYQKHKGRTHWDLRLGDTLTGQSHSWAIPKATLPVSKPLLAVQTWTHDVAYHPFEGTIGKGYGKGEVRQIARGPVSVQASPDRVEFSIPGEGDFLLRRTKDTDWIWMRKKKDDKTKF